MIVAYFEVIGLSTSERFVSGRTLGEAGCRTFYISGLTLSLLGDSAKHAVFNFIHREAIYAA